MNLKKTMLTTTVAAALSAAIVTPAQAVIIDMEFAGLLTIVDENGNTFQNYNLQTVLQDESWGYGMRTQISGDLSLNTATGAGSGAIAPFELHIQGYASPYDFELQSIGAGLMLGNMNIQWNGGDFAVQIVLDASGLFAEIQNGVSVGDIFDGATCATSGVCATPASDGIKKGKYPIGPVPIATSSFNIIGQTGFGTTLGQLSLGTDDGIGGSPLDNGPWEGFNYNYDMTSITVVSTVPIPAAVWLFGSGLIGLVGLARRKA